MLSDIIVDYTKLLFTDLSLQFALNCNLWTVKWLYIDVTTPVVDYCDTAFCEPKAFLLWKQPWSTAVGSCFFLSVGQGLAASAILTAHCPQAPASSAASSSHIPAVTSLCCKDSSTLRQQWRAETVRKQLLFNSNYFNLLPYQSSSHIG